MNTKHGILLSGVALLVFCASIGAVSADVYVPDNYTKIQWAIDNTTAGDTIIVKSGTYYENVNVHKQLILRGIDTGTGKPVVDAGGSGSAIALSADRVTLEGFMVTNSGGSSWRDAGIVVTSNNNIITGNNASNNFWSGIAIHNSSNNTITGNNAYNNDVSGICLHNSSSNNTITSNNAHSNDANGICLHNSSSNNTITGNNASNNYWSGIALREFCSNNTITENTACNNSQGILLYYSSNNNIITDNNASNNYDGIALHDSRNNTITENTACNNSQGILLYYSSDNNTITDNNASNNHGGIALHDSRNNTITGNNASNNDADGISLGYSSNNNTITGNTFVNDGLFVYEESYQNTVEGNTVNGMPLVYLEDTSDVVVTDAGQVILVKCNNISVENLDLSNTSEGIILSKTEDSLISYNSVSNNNNYGIYLFSSTNNTITGNTVSNNNDYGIYLGDSSSTKIYRNNFINNSNNAYDSNPASNDWHHPVLLEGNYWSDFTGDDDGSGTGKHAIAGDGIGDTNIPHPAADFDFYPFVNESGWIPLSTLFDTGSGTYPSIMGTHRGTITPYHDVNVSRMFTYTYTGTGGHSEYIRFYNESWDATANWDGYKGDWHTITFDEPFTLHAGLTYNYTISSGSYPQVHHNRALTVPGGEITCSEFVDVNGETYDNWILAIRLE